MEGPAHSSRHAHLAPLSLIIVTKGQQKTSLGYGKVHAREQAGACLLMTALASRMWLLKGRMILSL